jgi:hypothetical protein
MTRQYEVVYIFDSALEETPSTSASRASTLSSSSPAAKPRR